MARMERFARHYARELYVQFLSLSDPPASSAHTPPANGTL